MNAANAINAPISIVVGMHRSGTSLSTSLLQSAGLHVGRDLVGAFAGNDRGHFENVDFLTFHKQILRSQGLNEHGWTLQEARVSQIDREEAAVIVARNAVDSAWGWKDPRTTLFLEFWAAFLPQTCFLMVYRAPWEVADSLYRRGDKIIREQPELAIKGWQHYNQKILDLFARFPDRCMLANIHTITRHPSAWIEQIERRFQMGLSVPDDCLYEPELMQNSDGDRDRPSIINCFFPEAITVYEELERKAWYPKGETPDFAWRDRLVSQIDPVWVLRDWIDLCRLHRLQERQATFQKVKPQLTQARKKLAERRETLKQTRMELDAVKQQLLAAQHEIEQLKKQQDTQFP